MLISVLRPRFIFGYTSGLEKHLETIRQGGQRKKKADECWAALGSSPTSMLKVCFRANHETL